MRNRTVVNARDHSQSHIWRNTANRTSHHIEMLIPLRKLQSKNNKCTRCIVSIAVFFYRILIFKRALTRAHIQDAVNHRHNVDVIKEKKQKKKRKTTYTTVFFFLSFYCFKIQYSLVVWFVLKSNKCWLTDWKLDQNRSRIAENAAKK